MISQNEIQKLLSDTTFDELQLEFDTSIFEMSPKEARKIPDIVEKEKTLSMIALLDKVYVLPMQELANRLNFSKSGVGIKFDGIENYSITERLFILRNWLDSKGCKFDFYKHILPKTNLEVSILLKANALGFNLGFAQNQLVDNNDRVKRAQEFIKLSNEVKMMQSQTPVVNTDEFKEGKGEYGGRTSGY